MAYSTPLTAVLNAALTSPQWNASVRDNILETAVAKATTAGGYPVSTGLNTIAERISGDNYVGTSETSVSTTYDNLTTTGPSVTATSGPRTFVSFGCTLSNNTVNAQSFMGVDISGAATVAAQDALCVRNTSATANAAIAASFATTLSLTAGSSTYTAKYRVSANTGTFSSRRISIMPL